MRGDDALCSDRATKHPWPVTCLRCLLFILHGDSHEFENSSLSSSHIQKHHAKHHAQTEAWCHPVCANSSFNDLLVTANSCSEDLSLYNTPVDVPLPAINSNQQQPTATNINQHQPTSTISCLHSDLPNHANHTPNPPQIPHFNNPSKQLAKPILSQLPFYQNARPKHPRLPCPRRCGYERCYPCSRACTPCWYDTPDLHDMSTRWLTLIAEIVRKGEASADAVDIAQIGDGY